MRREIHRGKESPLEQGRAIYDTVHVHPVRKSVLNAATHVLISLRDPVDRFISAYNSNACLYGGESRDTCVRPSNPTTKLIMPKAREEEAAGAAAEEMLDLQDAHSSLGCFPNITAFADHLDDDSDCGRAARDVIHPPWAVHVKSEWLRFELLTDPSLFPEHVLSVLFARSASGCMLLPWRAGRNPAAQERPHCARRVL